MKHMTIRHIVRRLSEEIIATKKIASVTSWSDAFLTLIAKIDIQIMNHNGYKETKRIKQHLLKKHQVMNEYFERTYADFFKEYDVNEANLDCDSKFKDCIWICWWQGLENAPCIVQKCVESIRQNAGAHNVVLITESNYQDFVKFPDWVEEKKKKGLISRTHYSDLLRLELLANHGGIWLDSTFFCAKPILNSCFKIPLWSIKRPDYGHSSVACGYFANYSFGCNCENRWIFTVIRDFVLQYWKTNDYMIDYLFLDYIIVLIQQHYKEIKKAFDDIEPNNPLCDELYKVLDEEYDAQKWNELTEDTALFKLTWKQSFPSKKNGTKTFYGTLIEGDFDIT